jgi:FkbM family methyltransferase
MMKNHPRIRFNRDLIEHSVNLRQQLRIASSPGRESQQKDFQSPPVMEMDVVVTFNEINTRHGTGILLINLFGMGKGMLSIRSQNHYDGEQRFGDKQLLLTLVTPDRAGIYRRVLDQTAAFKPRRLICVPYSTSDILTALALRDAHQVPLCVYIMDDNCLFGRVNPIPQELMQELLDKATLRLAISPEMREAYENVFGKKFYLLPPLVKDASLRHDPSPPPQSVSRRGVLIGNIWNQSYLDALRRVTAESGVELDWYWNGYGKCKWLTVDEAALKADGITVYQPLPENELLPKLSTYAWALIPTGMATGDDEKEAIAKLSLPSRILFLIASAQLPVMVIGSADTAAARFIKHWKLGAVCAYDPAAFLACIQYLNNPETQKSIRETAHHQAALFSNRDAAAWVWRSLEKAAPADPRFENAFSDKGSAFAKYIHPTTPKDIFYSFEGDYQCALRLRHAGQTPAWVIDVGASTGIWSKTIAHIFPQALYLLIDPLISEYEKSGYCAWQTEKETTYIPIEALVADHMGEAEVNVSADLYNSSLLDDRLQNSRRVSRPVITLDSLMANYPLEKQGWLKLDVQFAEHLALAGGKKLLEKVDVCFVELSLWKIKENTKDYKEMILLFAELGFHLFDDVGEWRLPENGRLFQRDVVFVKSSIFETGIPS